MRIAYLDCFSGISGDMFLGALLDAGVPAKLFEETVAALNIGARLEISRVNRAGSPRPRSTFCSRRERVTARSFFGAARTCPEHEHEHSHEHELATSILMRASLWSLREHNYGPAAKRGFAGGGARAT